MLDQIHPNRTVASYILGLIWQGSFIRNNKWVHISRNGEIGNVRLNWIREQMHVRTQVKRSVERDKRAPEREGTVRYRLYLAEADSQRLMRLGLNGSRQQRSLPSDMEPAPFLLGIFDEWGYVSELVERRHYVVFRGYPNILNWARVYTGYDDYETARNTPPSGLHKDKARWRMWHSSIEYITSLYGILYNQPDLELLEYDREFQRKMLTMTTKSTEDRDLYRSRRQQIMELMEQGLEASEIAARLGTSRGGVLWHMGYIANKMGGQLWR